MNIVMLSRLLGWFSLAIGGTELAMPKTLSRKLGLPIGPWLIRAFGVREILAGVAVLVRPDHAFGPTSRIAGDAFDIAVLVPALSRRNPRRQAAHATFAMVLGITALDIWCASALATAENRRGQTAQRTRIAQAAA